MTIGSEVMFTGEELATIHDLAMDEIRALQDMVETPDEDVAPQLAVVNSIRDKVQQFFKELQG